VGVVVTAVAAEVTGAAAAGSMAAVWVAASEALRSAVDFAALRLTPAALMAAEILLVVAEEDLPEAAIVTDTVEV